MRSSPSTPLYGVRSGNPQSGVRSGNPQSGVRSGNPQSGVRSEAGAVRPSGSARNLHRPIGFRAIILMLEITFIPAAAPHPRSAVRVPREVVQRRAP